MSCPRAARAGPHLGCSFAYLTWLPSACGRQLACVCAAKQSTHEKQEGLRFLHICLASVLNLRSPDESELSGTPLDKLASMLFGTQVTAPRTAPAFAFLMLDVLCNEATSDAQQCSTALDNSMGHGYLQSDALLLAEGQEADLSSQNCSHHRTLSPRLQCLKWA